MWGGENKEEESLASLVGACVYKGLKSSSKWKCMRACFCLVEISKRGYETPFAESFFPYIMEPWHLCKLARLSGEQKTAWGVLIVMKRGKKKSNAF